MNRREYPEYGVDWCSERLDNGLEVHVLEKPDFHQIYAMFSTRYGSMDTRFRLVGMNDYTDVPDGVAHFLEHKMFEEPDGDVFQQFAQLGASANAFTTYDQTSYLFSSTTHAFENMKVLVDFVQNPYFTEENVAKEKGIIGEEIRMYDDTADWRCYTELLRAMYHSHPVRLDIAGTVESIAKITPQLLYRCYETFYHPANMVLVVAGPVNSSRVVEAMAENQAKKSFQPFPGIDRDFPREPVSVREKSVRHNLAVRQSRCLVGFKEKNLPTNGSDLLRQELLTGVLLDSVFGRAGETFEKMVDDGLADSTFGWEYEVTRSYGHAILGGNSAHPEALATAIRQHAERVLESGVSNIDFERSRKKTLGRLLASYDGLSALARDVTAYVLKGTHPFDALHVLQSITVEEAFARARELFGTEHMSASYILPVHEQAQPVMA
ncbi:MAG: pitrilysin family protein [Alicyclobacillaceae bacterium]|jgi:predicted Zn-dependent peptidase|uniref:EF-P 5-aminopentanol modification-associated protein YfmH n=1 Tax=Alicyclobacillus sp. SP_1 TaxID=2942475 RepID=UPI002157E55E|nr:pitrilysin family protein [Alicyclobacillus sp. SP_1]MCY0887579.1 pitrilysin family protein [Alicyclobacillaceae bacterium]